MSKKHIFSLFSDDDLTSLFVEWSHAHNISFLDSACCNKTDRIIFLNLLLKHKCVALRNEEMSTTCETLTNKVMKYIFVCDIKLLRLLVNLFCISKSNVLFPHDDFLLSFFTEAQPDKFLSDIYDKDIICGTAAPFGVVKDFWKRVEFQERGTPHLHYLINEH